MRPLLLPLLAAGLLAADLTITPDHADGVYKAGEAVTWTVSGGAAGEGPAYVVQAGGLTELAKGKLAFTDGKATVSATLDQPGTLLLSVKVDDKTTVRGGAAVAWEEIKPSAPEPADFDAFWKEKLAELAAVPADPKLEEIDSGSPEVQLWKITLANIRGSHINGYLARPKGDAACPAMLQVQYAGVYPLNKAWVLEPAKKGWLALNIIAHDLPVDKDKAFYDELANGALKNYRVDGVTDREKFYFLRMYLSCHRAADYLATRPDWNRKTLLVQGGSQGGLQSVVTAGLHPAVTAVTANVPAGCDHTGDLVGRANGWPNLIGGTKGAEREARLKVVPYFDVVNFAARVRCPTLIGMGLVDTTCPPAGVFAMYNRLAGPKRIVIMPPADHKGPHNVYYGTMGGWWSALKDGKAPPLK